MSGHSKWATTKHQKAITDSRRGKLFTKLSKEIIVAVKQGGGPDPDGNARLRMAIQRARDNSMPADNIERAIKRGSGEGADADMMEEIVYEGYGPGGTAILLQVLTDNKNRTVSEIRSTLTRSGGNMANAGAVAWQFSSKGLVVAEADAAMAEDIALAAIDAGAEDIDNDENVFTVYSPPENTESVRQALTELGATVTSSELDMVAQNTVALDEKTALKALKLLYALEELDDVQKVYSNGDFPDEALEQWENES